MEASGLDSDRLSKIDLVHEVEEDMNPDEEPLVLRAEDDLDNNNNYHSPSPSLPLPLQCLFAINGITLALPTTALMYIVNTRVEMPLSYLPSYGALAFLPFSLKPLYGYLSDCAPQRRDTLISLLLILSAISIVITTWIPEKAVMVCFLVSFVRGVFSAWPEFLLGITLIEEASLSSDEAQKRQNSAQFQAQAATARNLGSLLAHAGALVILSPSSQMRSSDATLLLVITSIFALVGAIIAWLFQVGTVNQAREDTSQLSRSSSYNSCDSDIEMDEDCQPVTAASKQDEPSITGTYSHGNIRLIVLLQVTTILISLQGPISDLTSNTSWRLMAATSFFSLLIVAWFFFTSLQWKPIHSVGLFLILRHFIPSASYLVSSYLYEILAPAVLQLLSLIGMATAVLSSWSYGKLFSPYAENLSLIIVATTVLAAMASFGYLPLYYWYHDYVDTESTTVYGWPMVVVTIVVKIAIDFFEEWNFLPDVILATTTVVVTNELSSSTMAYGSLISCVDFGDLLGALSTTPLVHVLNISRENQFARLDTLIVLCAVLLLLSSGFVTLLPRRVC